MGSCSGISNRCRLGLSNQLAGRYAPDNELEIIRFFHLHFGEFLWRLIPQVNNGLLDAYITVPDPRRGKRRRLIHFLVYALVYTSIASKLVTLDTLSPWSDSVYTHTCSPFLKKLLLG